MDGETEYTYIYWAKRINIPPFHFHSVSSFTSQADSLFSVSAMSIKPPGKSRVPLAGSLARRHTNNSFRSFHYQCHGGGRRVEVIDEFTVGTTFGLFIVDFKMHGATLGAVFELGKRMFHKWLNIRF